MSKKTITVRAGDGLMMHLPTRVAAAPGGTGLILTGDMTAEVHADDRFVIKRIKKGDLVVVKQTRATKPKAKSAGETKKTEG